MLAAFAPKWSASPSQNEQQLSSEGNFYSWPRIEVGDKLPNQLLSPM
jgi:hypothetical protein